MSNVLVIGSNGALGSALVRALKKNEGPYSIYLSSRNPVDDMTKRLDIQDLHGLKRLIIELMPAYIFNLAVNFSRNIESAIDVNVRSSASLLGIVKENAPNCRVLLMGSAAEYGVVRASDNPISESQPLNPVSVYGLTKSWQTQLALYYSQLGVNVSVCRIFNLDGPGISDSLFVGRLQKEIQEVLSGRKLHIEFGSLDAIRDYINIDEAAQQIIDIALIGRAGETYNVASGVPIKISKLLERYLKDHNLPLTVVRSESKLGNHVGYDVPEIYADITKIKSLTKKSKII